MKKLPGLAYLTILAAALAVIFLLGPRLPEQVATHFTVAGTPDSWMTRERAVWSFAAFAAGISAFIPALSFLIRFLPADLLNVPRKDYWRLPENYPKACEDLLRWSFGIAALSVIFVSGCFLLLVRANRISPPALSSATVGGLAAIYLGVLAIGIVQLTRHFSSRPANDGIRDHDGT